MIGQRFGSLVVTAEAGRSKHGLLMWKCDCDCGGTSIVAGAKLRHETRRCRACRNRIFGNSNLKHGATRGHSNGAPVSSTYSTWTSMLNRCLNPKNHAYANYGGRGIKVCERWQGEGGFESFLADMGEKPDGFSIERINNDLGYEPGNCKWASLVEQQRNRRNVKLSETAVALIRYSAKRGAKTCDIAWAFGVRREHINKVVRGEVWR